MLGYGRVKGPKFGLGAWAEIAQASARPMRIFCTSLVPS
jgi:hypothetical protein